MEKLFYHPGKDIWGVTTRGLSQYFPGTFFSNDIEGYRGWVTYETVKPEERPYYRAVEARPLNGKQQWTYEPVDTKENIIRSIMTEIDDLVAKIFDHYNRFRGEFEQREKEANEYLADTSRPPGELLASFAYYYGVSTERAAKIVMRQSRMLRAAEIKLGKLRMRKYEIKRTGELDEAITIRNEILGEIYQTLGAIAREEGRTDGV